MKALKTIGLILLLACVSYVSFASQRFFILHPKAGSGCFFVYFKEVVLLKEVPRFQEGGPER